MLTFYVENDLKLRHLRQCPIGRYLDGFADWLRLAGYKQRPAQQILRGASWSLSIGTRCSNRMSR